MDALGIRKSTPLPILLFGSMIQSENDEAKLRRNTTEDRKQDSGRKNGKVRKGKKDQRNTQTEAGRRLRSKDSSLFFDLTRELAEQERQRPGSLVSSKYEVSGKENAAAQMPSRTFSCVCTNCGDTDICQTDYMCMAMTHKNSESSGTTYSCLEQHSFLNAYCIGGQDGKFETDNTVTVCCSHHMCNNVSAPPLPPTTSPSRSTPPYTVPGALLGSILGPILILAILTAVIVFVYRYITKVNHKRQLLKRSKENSYIGDSLSAQPWTEDCSIELPDPTSGSGSGMPMLVQRTVAKSVSLDKQIGTGKYGSVWRGNYMNSPVAVKIFLSKDIDSWQRENEIYNTSLLRHENVLGFLAADMTSQASVTQFWLITHYHENGSLYDYLNEPENAVNLSQVLLMLSSAAAGLVHLHTEICGTQPKPAIAHRDIKSKNILVKADGSCCIADLGLAVTHKSEGNQIDLGNNKKVGTKRYMAPEILNETMCTNNFESFKRADIYAFSLVMWETAQCCITSGFAGQYQMPYGGMVQNDPTFEEMRQVVVLQKKRPPIPAHWSMDKVLSSLSKVIRECWCEASSARLPALRIKKTLSNLFDETKDGKAYL